LWLPIEVLCFNSYKTPTKELNNYFFTSFLIDMGNISIVSKLVILCVNMTERKQSVNTLYVSNVTLGPYEKLDYG
jgi:hypothetical protein